MKIYARNNEMYNMVMVNARCRIIIVHMMYGPREGFSRVLTTPMTFKSTPPVEDHETCQISIPVTDYGWEEALGLEPRKDLLNPTRKIHAGRPDRVVTGQFLSIAHTRLMQQRHPDPEDRVLAKFTARNASNMLALDASTGIVNRPGCTYFSFLELMQKERVARTVVPCLGGTHSSQLVAAE
ncbi:hypothetical protein BO85DRAFT_475333 [Aspergillus piperis CBS 112811]|uniref:Uncharacterized protein n=1 Tax=Aspergillus piperis CBS 112811 TaxID=1448313 RepID=A0A8G1VPP9_9EURO|nr:hypothetical protein BO85DRAFT_475333 [Aspergillus piperis CBS 112811]RAH61204.1 hypothetical protein BO85DRAFT_475333 [Aspergillus piperis CBS 112811]